MKWNCIGSAYVVAEIVVAAREVAEQAIKITSFLHALQLAKEQVSMGPFLRG